MATSELTRPGTLARDAPLDRPLTGTRFTVARLLAGLASLRLTVLLFAASIFLVFSGTLAQVDHGVWQVVNHAYFRVWIARIDWQAFERLVQIFASVHWNLAGGFYFPGGKTIGILLLANLLAAHAVRFKVTTTGLRLWGGLTLLALGVVVTALAIRSGMSDRFASELTPAFCSNLWQSLRAVLAGLVLLGAYLLMLNYGRIRREGWWLLLSLDLIPGAIAVWLFLNPDVRLTDSDLQILWPLVKGLAAGLVLLVGCVLAFRARAGIVLLHGGVALLMCSELWTGLTATEAQMTIDEGATTNFASDIRTTELAVVDQSKPNEDLMTVVPAQLLVNNVGATESIEHADLPFSVQVLRWFPNSELKDATAGAVNPATAGAGLRFVAEERRPGTGVSKDDTVDYPSAYVELRSKLGGKSLGTYLVSALLVEQPVDVDGQSYDLSLRFKRMYYPYSLTLKDFRFDRYVGTNTPKNYSSLVELNDPGRSVDREIKIWMNNPLRYAGNTFYQADFDQQTERTTVLQVVSNAGWMTPYVSCMLVLTGMLAHFGVVLVRFLRRQSTATASELEVAGNSRWTALLAKWFPALVVVFFALYLGSKARMPHANPNEMQLQEFAKLPLAYQGRIKPYDTLARNALLYLSGRQELIGKEKPGWLAKLFHSTEKTPAINWLLDVISGSQAAENHRIFRIENLELLDTLGLPHRELSWRYSLAELGEKSDVFKKQLELADAVPENEQSLYQRKVIELAKKRSFYALLVLSFRSLPTQAELDRLGVSMDQLQQVVATFPTAQAPLPVPPVEPDGLWTTMMQAELNAMQDRATNRSANPAPAVLGALLKAYAQGDAVTFNKQLLEYRRVVAGYEESLSANPDRVRAAGFKKSEILAQRRVNFEVFYNHLSPFVLAAVFYVIAFLLGVLSLLGWTRPLRRASIWLVCFTFAIHTFALWARIDISGRPPVTNLYSAAVFIGWACVLFAMVFESLNRLGLGNIVASVAGFLTLLVAHFLSLDGDTLIVMQAVLDTQLWLATHVLCINLGYGATYLAGLFGIAYVLLAQVFPVLSDADRRVLTRMIYGILCFAILFSFVGTVLGGLWADNSWGRFWGWDPKENGALIIVLFNALILHARWGGMIGPRGLAVLTLGGNIVITWSFFGVNELGVGLHSYGASESSTAMWLLAFTASQLVLIVLGLIPQEWFTAMWGAKRSSTTR